jgi:hypothetical protein
MVDNAYKLILDATAGAPLPFVLLFLVATFIIVNAAAVSVLAHQPLPNINICMNLDCQNGLLQPSKQDPRPVVCPSYGPSPLMVHLRQ